MKKIIIILAVILTSGATAIALTRTGNKAEIAKMNSDKAAVNNNAQVVVNHEANLATAD